MAGINSNYKLFWVSSKEGDIILGSHLFTPKLKSGEMGKALEILDVIRICDGGRQEILKGMGKEKWLDFLRLLTVVGSNPAIADQIVNWCNGQPVTKPTTKKGAKK